MELKGYMEKDFKILSYQNKESNLAASSGSNFWSHLAFKRLCLPISSPQRQVFTAKKKLLCPWQPSWGSCHCYSWPCSNLLWSQTLRWWCVCMHNNIYLDIFYYYQSEDLIALLITQARSSFCIVPHKMSANRRLLVSLKLNSDWTPYSQQIVPWIGNSIEGSGLTRSWRLSHWHRSPASIPNLIYWWCHPLSRQSWFYNKTIRCRFSFDAWHLRKISYLKVSGDIHVYTIIAFKLGVLESPVLEHMKWKTKDCTDIWIWWILYQRYCLPHIGRFSSVA